MRAVQEILDGMGAGYRLRVERLADNGASVLDQILEALGGLDVEVVDGRGKRLK